MPCRTCQKLFDGCKGVPCKKESPVKYRLSAASRSLVFKGVQKMSFRKQAMKYGSAVGLMVSGVAQAAVPASVDTAITTMATDAATVAAAVLVAIIGVVAIKFIRKGL